MMPQAHLEAAAVHATYGELIYHAPFHSGVLGNERGLIVYLPPGYRENETRRYPVLYMQDGQNLFDGRTSFVQGQHWHLNEAADNLIWEGAIEPLIIVGIYHAGQQRIEEYTPTRDPNFKVGGRADLYGEMLVRELKPLIDREYRTLPGREHTGIGGSSLGGLVSLHLGLRRPEIFSRIIAMSPSLWWNRRWIFRSVEELEGLPQGLRLWLDAGTCEGGNTRANACLLRDLLERRGLRAGAALGFMEADGASHCEQDWAQRAPHALRHAYPSAKI